MPNDPKTLQAGPKTDAMVAEWMGWKRVGGDPDVVGWHDPESGEYRSGMEGNSSRWSPSTNVAHAGEARRKRSRSHVHHWTGICRVEVHVEVGMFEACCNYDEVTGGTEEEIKGKAEALAICRAIAEEMKAKKES